MTIYCHFDNLYRKIAVRRVSKQGTSKLDVYVTNNEIQEKMYSNNEFECFFICCNSEVVPSGESLILHNDYLLIEDIL